MTAQVYQIRDYQPSDTPLRVLRKQVEDSAREIAVMMNGFCGPGDWEISGSVALIDTSPCEQNPDDCA